jgi:hypothetical protein
LAWKEYHLSTLTKIAIVVLAVLVLLATPLFIQQAAVPQNWRENYNQLYQKLQTSEVNRQQLALAEEAWRQSYLGEKTKREELMQQSQSDAEQNRITLANLRQDLAVRDSQLQQLTANYNGLKAELQKAVDFNAQQAKELKQVQTDLANAQDQLRQARDKIQEDATQIELLTQSQRVAAAQLTEKEAELADIKREVSRTGAAGGAGTPSVAAGAAKPVPAAGPRIEGTITAVKGDTASLNIGAASGIKQGMEFIIYRGPDFVAHLQISLVNASTSAGVIVNAQRDVKQGDKATNKLGTE